MANESFCSSINRLPFRGSLHLLGPLLLREEKQAIRC